MHARCVFQAGTSDIFYPGGVLSIDCQYQGYRGIVTLHWCPVLPYSVGTQTERSINRCRFSSRFSALTSGLDPHHHDVNRGSDYI